MKTQFENKYNMYLSLKDFFLSRLAVFMLLPHFSEFHTLFLDCLTRIATLSEQWTKAKSSANIVKPVLRKQLILLMLDTTKKFFAYAQYIKDDVLISQALFVKTKTPRASNSKLVDYGNTIYNLAQESLEALNIYGITAASQLLLRKAIDDFKAANPSVKNTALDLKSISSNLAKEFAIAKNTTDEIGYLVASVESSNPELFKAYQNAIKIYNYGGRSYDVLVQVDQAGTDQGIKGVLVAATLNGSPANVFSKKTAAKGGFRANVPADGIYTFTFRKVGFKDQSVTRAIVKGEHCLIKINMVPEVYSNPV
jgi:hypothetical protein